MRALAAAHQPPESLPMILPDGEWLELLDQATVDADGVPEPYRRLLDHEQDMTSTLEHFWGERLALRPLAVLREGGLLRRQVALIGAETGRPVEFGAITIHLDRFSSAARRAIVEGRLPLGSILAQFHVPYSSRPSRFLRLPSVPPIARRALALATDAPARFRTLYGRENTLRTPQGEPLAEVVEILPPLPADAP